MTLLRPGSCRDYERVMLPKLINLEDKMNMQKKDGEGA